MDEGTDTGLIMVIPNSRGPRAVNDRELFGVVHDLRS